MKLPLRPMLYIQTVLGIPAVQYRYWPVRMAWLAAANRLRLINLKP